MIDKLTQRQEQDLKNKYIEYLKIGRDCTPVDIIKAKEDISRLYEWGGLEAPTHFFHFSSPMICELFINLICSNKSQLWGQLWGQLGDQLWGQLRGQLGDQLWGQLRGQLRDQLRDQLRGQLRDQLWGQLWDQLGGQLWGQLRDQLWDQLWGQLGDQLGGQLRDQLWGQLRGQLKLKFMGTWFNGQQDAFWISFYKFGEEIGAKYKTKSSKGLNIWNDIARSCHWFYPFNDFCLISDKPRFINVDDRGRLHSITEKAIQYSDGWGFYSVHGVIVPGWIIETPGEITEAKITAEENVEIRRVMLDLYGWDKYLDGYTPIHQDEFGSLYKRELLNDEPLVMVKVKNTTPEPDGTHKDYFLRVPPTIKTAREAVAWTFDMESDEYAPTAEA